MADNSSTAGGVVLLILGIFGLITGIILSMTIIGIFVGVPVCVLSGLMMGLGIKLTAGTPTPQQQYAPPYYQQAPQAVAVGSAAITVVAGGRHISSLPMIAGSVYTVGRGGDNAVVLTDPGVSSVHARISVHGPGQVSIEDLGSTNGVFLSGNRITTLASLASGSAIRLGANQMIELSW